MPNFKVAVLIDGGFLRVVAKRMNKIYDPDFIEKFANACPAGDESIFRILYYDCAMYSGTVKLPSPAQAILTLPTMLGSTPCRTRIYSLCGGAS
jgi:hypothetical protein